MPIEVKNIFYTYLKKTPNAFKALDDVSLHIDDHSFVGFIGQTGSGKSTLVQHFNALLVPDEGEIVVDDFVITNSKKKNKKIHDLRKHVGMVFQFPEYQLFEETVEKDVAFGPKNFGHKDKEALEYAHAALKEVGIGEEYFKRSPFELSGGERRRVAIAGILAINPDILVLDEPTAGLDPTGSQDIMNLVQRLYDSGKSIILVTHDMDLVTKYCQKVFVVKDGKIAYSGEPSTLFENIDESYSVEVPALYKTVQALNKRGWDIDLKDIKDVSSLVEIIKKRVNNG